MGGWPHPATANHPTCGHGVPTAREKIVTETMMLPQWVWGSRRYGGSGLGMNNRTKERAGDKKSTEESGGLNTSSTMLSATETLVSHVSVEILGTKENSP